MDVLTPLLVPWGVLEITTAFVALIVFVAGFAALYSRSLTVAVWGAFAFFAYLALEIGTSFLTQLFILSFVVMLVAFGFKLTRLEALGGGS